MRILFFPPYMYCTMGNWSSFGLEGIISVKCMMHVRCSLLTSLSLLTNHYYFNTMVIDPQDSEAPAAGTSRDTELQRHHLALVMVGGAVYPHLAHVPMFIQTCSNTSDMSDHVRTRHVRTWHVRICMFEHTMSCSKARRQAENRRTSTPNVSQNQ